MNPFAALVPLKRGQARFLGGNCNHTTWTHILRANNHSPLQYNYWIKTAIFFCDASIPNSSPLIPNFQDVAHRVPTVAVGGQCVKIWWQFVVDADTLWTLQLYKLYKLFRLYSLLLIPYSFLKFSQKKFCSYKIKCYLCSRIYAGGECVLILG